VALGRLVQLEAPVGGHVRAALLERAPLRFRHGLQSPGQPEVLLQHAQGVDPADRGGDGEAHRVAERLGGGHRALLYAGAVAEALHADDADPAADQHGEHPGLEAPEAGVEAVQRELDGVEREAAGEHVEMDGRVLVPGEADETGLAFAFRPLQRLHRAPGLVVPRGVVVVHDLVDLPQVEVVGLHRKPRGDCQIRICGRSTRRRAVGVERPPP
jgi:hypothetical protein